MAGNVYADRVKKEQKKQKNTPHNGQKSACGTKESGRGNGILLLFLFRFLCRIYIVLCHGTYYEAVSLRLQGRESVVYLAMAVPFCYSLHYE